jgi:mRNA interferase MazF
VVAQGDVFWANIEEPAESAPDYAQPCVIVQNNVFKRSRIRTVVTCALATNLGRARDPGMSYSCPGRQIYRNRLL